MSECSTFNTKVAVRILRSILMEKKFLDKQGNPTDSPELRARIIEYFRNLTSNGGLNEEEIGNFITEIIKVYNRAGLIQNDFYTNRKTIQNTLIRVQDNTYNENSVSVSKLVDTDTEQSVRQASSKFLEDAYGSAVYVKQFAERTFKFNIFNYCFINRFKLAVDNTSNKDGLIDNNGDLNRNILKYQQELVNEIQKYLELIDFKDWLPNKPIYDKEFNYSRLDENSPLLVIDQIISRVSTFLSPDKFDPLTLADRFRRMSEGDKKAEAFIRAYNAYITLKHFDTFLQLSIGNLITINNQTNFNVRTANKYSLAVKTAANNTTWRTSEVADITKELDKITRLAIETTPLYNYGEFTPSSTDFISFRDFQYIITRLKKIANTEFAKKFEFTIDTIGSLENHYFFDSTDKGGLQIKQKSKEGQALQKFLNYISGKTLSEVITGISNNPVTYTSYLFELFTNKNFLDMSISIKVDTKSATLTARSTLSEVGIGSFDLKVLWSLYYSVFGISPNSIGSTTLWSSSRTSKVNYYEYLTHTVNTIFSPTYIQYYKDEDNNLNIRNLTDTSLTSDIYTIKTLLNVSLMQKTLEQLENGYSIKYETDDNNKVTKVTMTLKEKEDDKVYELIIDVADGAVKITDTKSQNSEEFDLQISTALKIVDKVLGTIYSQNPNITTILRDIDLAIGKDLLGMIGRAIAIKALSVKELTETGSADKKGTLTALAERLGDKTKFNRTYKGLDTVHASSVKAINALAYAIAKSRGIASIGRVKSGEGNELGSTVLSRLVDSMEYQIDHFTKTSVTEVDESIGKIKPVVKDCLIVKDRGSVFEGTLKAEDFADAYKSTKEAIKFSGQELTYSSFMYDYIGGFIQTPPGEVRQVVGDGHILLFPCTMSDKPYYAKIKINLNAPVQIKTEKGIKTTTLRSCSYGDIINLITSEFSTIYNNQANNILIHYKILFSNAIFPDTTKQGLFKELQQKILSAQSIEKVFEILENPKYKELTLPDGSAINSVQALNYFVQEHNYRYPTHPLSFLDGVHYKAKEQYLKIDPVFKEYLTLFNNPELVKQFFKSKQEAIISSMLRTGFSLENLNTQNDKYARKLYEFLGLLDEVEKEWYKVTEDINSKNDRIYDVVLAKIRFTIEEEGKATEKIIHIFSKTSLYENLSYLYELKPKMTNIDGTEISLQEMFTLPIPRILEIIKYNFEYNSPSISIPVSIELNPIIQKYNALDYLLTQEYMISTVGSILGHPGKSDAEKYNAQNKRNVSYTASMYAFEFETIAGAPRKARVAVVDSLKLSQGTIDGSISKVSPWDGGTFVNPVFVYLENYSLGGNKVGITKKPLIHSYNPETGTGTLIKTAGFGITLNWARNSAGIAAIMKKMMDMTWFSESGQFASQNPNSYSVDITKNFYDNAISYGFDKLFFRVEQPDGTYKYYRIESIKKQETLVNEPNTGKPVNNTYTRVIQEVDINNKVIEGVDSITEVDIPVTSNWQLLNLLGGIQSMELRNGKLETSEQAIERLVDACIFVGDIKSEQDRGAIITSQDQVWQPLKHADIHYLSDGGSVKQGIANKNAYKDLFDPTKKLNFYSIDLIQAGIQLDKEHHVDEAQVSLMTQVISACAFKGYTVKDAEEIYKALNTITNLKIKDFAKAIFAGDEVDLGTLRQLVVQSVIKALSSSINNTSFASIIAKELISKARNGGKVTFEESTFALSDAAIYGKLISSITSFLTKEGIKQHLSGSLSVLSPSHDLIKLHNGKLLENVTQDELRRAQIEAMSNPIYLAATNVEESIDRTYLIDLGVTYIVTDAFGKTKSETVTTPLDYLNLKRRTYNGEVKQIVEDIQAGRQLGCYNARFEGDDGKIYQLYDIDEVQQLFELEFIRGEKDPTEQLNKLKEFAAKYSTDDSTFAFKVNPQTNSLESVEDYFKRISKYLRTQTELILQQLRPDQQYSIKNQYEKAVSLLANAKTVKELQTAKTILRHKLFIITKGKVDLDQIAGYKEITTLEDLNGFLKANVSTIINRYEQVKINGKYITIKRETINIKPYEIVMAKTFKTKYGLDDKVDLQKILENKDYFFLQYLSTPVVQDSKAYDIAIKRPGRENIYVIDSNSQHDLEGLTEVSVPIYEENGRHYTLDGTEVDYEVPSDATFYKDSHGNLYILTKQVEKICKDIEGSGFYINYKKMPADKQAEYVQHYLEKLSKGNYHFIRAITKGKIEDTIKILELLESTTISTYKDLSDENKDLLEPLKEYYNIKWVSFKQSLEVIAGRTPAQSKQSFMPMRIVAFDNPDINNAYVSTMQLLLQGSDYDIDAVTITTYSINDNGVLQTWSPFTRYDSTATLEASMNLPFPTGQELEPEFANETTIANFIKKYQQLFSFRVDKKEDKKELSIRLNLNAYDGLTTRQKLVMLKAFLEEISTVKFALEDNDALAGWIKETLNEEVPNGTMTIQNYLIQIANRHNTYLSRLSTKQIDNAVSNQAVHSISKVAKNPGDLFEAQVGLDNCTAPLDAEADSNLEEKLYFANSGPGNFLGKIEAFLNNQIGKECVGIAANGLKIFAAITTYMNNVLNEGTLEEQKRLISAFKFRDTEYKLIADVKSLDVNSIQDPEILAYLAKVAAEDSDAALSLSALLSLAVDNAKNLKLAKINASQTMLPLYIFGVTMGITIPELVKVLNSRTGRLISGLIQGNIFKYNNPIKNINNAVALLVAKGNGSKKIINSFLYNRGEIAFSDDLAKVVKQVFDERKFDLPENTSTFGDIITGVMQTIEDKNKGNYDYGILLDIISLLKDPKLKNSSKLKATRQLLLDIYTAKTERVLGSIKQLANGAKECRQLGQFLSLNQGIPNTPQELYQLVEAFETCAMSKSDSSRVDLRQFVADADYRQEKIEQYEKKKVAVNILAVLANNPQYMGYLKDLASAHESAKTTFIYRAIIANIGNLYKDLGTDLSNKGLKDRIYKGYQRAIQAKMISTFLQSEQPIMYPANATIYKQSNREIRQLKSNVVSLELPLGTDIGNATFKKWMEEQVIPDLKKGSVGTNQTFESLRSNPFIQDLSAQIVTNTPLRNATIVQSLPINMLPKDEVESMNLDKYRQAFAELATYNYSYTTTKIIDGKLTKVNRSIPILDLFAYYTLIVYNWQQSQKSLLQLFSQIYSQSVVKRYTDFVKALDVEGEINPDPGKPGLILNFESDVLPHVVFNENPYSTTSKYLLVYNNISDQNEIWKSTKQDEDQQSSRRSSEFEQEFGLEEIAQEDLSLDDVIDEEEIDGNRSSIPFAPFSDSNPYADSADFPLGYARGTSKVTMTFKGTIKGKSVTVPITLDSISETHVTITLDESAESYKEISNELKDELKKKLKDIKLPIKTVDDVDTVDIKDATAILNSILNPCKL